MTRQFRSPRIDLFGSESQEVQKKDALSFENLERIRMSIEYWCQIIKLDLLYPKIVQNSIITQSGFLIRPPLCCILSFRWWRLLSYQAVEFHIHNRIQEAVNSQSLFQIVLFFPVSEKVMSSGRCECARSAWFRSL